MGTSNCNATLTGRLQGELDALGNGEPKTFLQAEAITEKIRISKGHLDDDVRLDLDNLRPQNRALVLGFVEENRKTLAAFNKRY